MTQLSHTIPFDGTTHLPVTFPAGATILFVPAPAVIHAPSLVIPPRFAAAFAGPEPLLELDGLVIPVSFGPITVTLDDPEEPPPDPHDPPTVPGGSTVAVAAESASSGTVQVSEMHIAG